jgi:large subunit ribosomal protein L21
LTAVVVSGGKQYRVASGDRILVDRMAAEPGAELTLERVLMVADADGVKVGAEALAGQVVRVRVLEHRRGPKIDVLRYRPKKRVRVHRGARAELTALEVLSVGPREEPRAQGARKAEPTGSGERPAAARRSRSTKPAEAPAAEPAEAVEASE